MYKNIGLMFILSWLMLTGCKDHHFKSESPSAIPSSVIEAIVKETLDKTHPKYSKATHLVDLRTRQVREYLASVGGEQWYKNYVYEFNTPQEEVSSNPQNFQTHSFASSYIGEFKGTSEHHLGYYYIHRPATSPENLIKFNCMADHPIVINPSLTITKSPTMDAFCGLANFNAYQMTTDKKYYDVFMNWANIFVANQKNGRWEWMDNVDARGIKAPWISGLTQSLAISLLLRAYQSTGDMIYLKTARKALQWLKLPMSKGGVAFQTNQGTWYEEYPNKNEPSHVLNGHIWALFGLWDFYRVTGDAAIKKMFDDGIAVIKASIHHYDLGYWVVYAGTNRLDAMKGNYMSFVTEQMKVLYGITGDPFFRQYANKWSYYQNNDMYFVHMAAEQFLKSSFASK